MNELDDRLHTLRDQLRTAVSPGAAPSRRPPARFPTRRVLAIATVVVLVAAGAVALSRRHRGTTPPGYQGPASTVVSGLATNRKPNARYVVPSEAMEPTLPTGRVALVHTPADDPLVGEIVVHAARDTGALLVKRIVAGPGDTVAAVDGRVVRNGVLVDEPYLAPGARTEDFGPVQIPSGMWWVLGDNRSNSQDSRFYGPIDAAALRGVVTSVLPENASIDLPLLEQPPTAGDIDPPATTEPVGSASACKASKTAIATAAEAYYAKLGTYPPDLRALQTAGFVSDFGAELDADGKGLTSPARGPSDAFTIRYERAADENSYTITASDGC